MLSGRGSKMWTFYVAIAGCLLCTGDCAIRNSFGLMLKVVSYTSSAEDACIGGDVGLTDTSILLQIRHIISQEEVSDWKNLANINLKNGFEETQELSSLINRPQGVQFRLLQLEHGGGSCNCWTIEANITSAANLNDRPIGICFPENLGSLHFCGGLARNARGLVSEAYSHISILNGTCPNGSNKQLIDRIRKSIPNNCSSITPKLEMSYALIVDVERGGCGGPEGVEDAIEFSIRTNTSGVYGPWIPLRLTWRWPDNNKGNYTINTTRVRGYDVETHGVPLTSVTQQVTVCGEDLLPSNASEVQFRWMSTTDQPGRYDMWAIFNVTVDLFTNNDDVYRILDTETEGFSVWQEVRNGSTKCTACTDVLPCRKGYLTFGGFQNANITPELHTKMALTEPISLAVCEFCDLMDSSGQISPSSVLPDSIPLFSSPIQRRFATSIEESPLISTETTTSQFDSLFTPSPTITSITSSRSIISASTSPSSQPSPTTTYMPSPTSTVFSQPSLPDPTSGVSSQPSLPGPTSGVSSQPSMPSPTSGVSSQPSLPGPTSGVSSQPSLPGPTSGVSSQPSLPGPTSGVSSQPSLPGPTSGVSSQPSMPRPTSGVSSQPSLPGPTSGVSSQPSLPGPTSGVSSQPSLPGPTSGVSSQPSLPGPTSGVSSQPSFPDPTSSTSQSSSTSVSQPEPNTSDSPSSTASPASNNTQSASMIRDQFAATIAQEIRNNSELSNILNAEPLIAVTRLLDLSPSPAITLYLIGDILNRINRDDLTESLIKNLFQVLDSLSISPFRKSETRPDVVGSSFLSSLDRLTLEFPFERNFTGNNTFIQTRLVSADTDVYTPIIDSEDFVKDAPRMSISLPPELLGKFTRSGEGRVQVISAVLYGVEELFPNEGPRSSTGSFLGPGILSTSLVCESDTLCDTNQLNLTDPVLINFEHSQEVIGNTSHNFKVECVFWNFLAEGSNESAGLTIGEWSSEGCSPNNLSNDSYTVCECDHLTHFAILLSPVPVDFDENNITLKITLSLEVIGYVGVSISLVAMTITILTFLIFRSLHNIRSYIHIHLCINLMIAQLIFVVGIDKSAEDHVPVHCQVIAVLLHYFFLVSFMWMLMEGVVLYVVLVLVFTKRRKLYMFCFTLVSYGLPLVYMGLLTLPLGFSLDNQHYGSTSHCFLNPETHFIWAFIAPVILIIVVNFVLFLIVVRVMWKHQKKRKDNTNVANVRKWLRSAVFLVVVMGITWIVGVSVTEVEALLPLAYIFTIMVAFQGFAIFLMFVIFSKQVREAYRKWWKVRVNNSTVLSKYFGDFSLTLGSSSKSNGGNAKAMIGSEQKNSSLLNDSVAKEKNCPDDSVVIANPDSS